MSESSRARRPRLLWVNQFALLPSDGGGTRHFELGRQLTRLGWDVTIVASDFHLHARRYSRRSTSAEREPIVESVDGVRFVWVHSEPYERNDWRRARNWVSFARAAIAAAPVVGPTSLVIGSSPQPLAALAGLRLARRLHAPFVLEVRDLWPESLEAISGRRGAAYHLIGALMRYLYPRAARTIVLARGVGERVVADGYVQSERVLYAPNGVDPSAVGDRRPDAHATFTVLYAGAHGPANALDVVLDAADRLRGRSEIRFLLVGDGPDKPALIERARTMALPNIEFRDSIPKSRMNVLFDEVDAGLMVLRDTPLFAFGVSPNKLFDYLGAGLPVVNNVSGELADMVRAAGAGVQARDGTGTALADAISTLQATSADERLRLGRAGRAWVLEEHSREVVARRLDASLRSILA